jgi:hypothetical protein
MLQLRYVSIYVTDSIFTWLYFRVLEIIKNVSQWCNITHCPRGIVYNDMKICE